MKVGALKALLGEHPDDMELVFDNDDGAQTGTVEAVVCKHKYTDLGSYTTDAPGEDMPGEIVECEPVLRLDLDFNPT